jgi:hypothetical protein
LDKKLSHFQTFGLEVLLSFTENAAKEKEMREGTGIDLLVWLGWEEENRR